MLGKIVIALAAIGTVLGGLIDVGQGLIFLSNGGKPVALFLWIILWGSLRIALGYGFYTLLDIRKSGLIVSIAKFLAVLVHLGLNKSNFKCIGPFPDMSI